MVKIQPTMSSGIAGHAAQRVGDEDVPPLADQPRAVDLVLQEVDCLAHLVFSEGSDDDRFGVELARHFARRLQTNHSCPAENEDCLGDAARHLPSS
ncbi:MAG: hypothetical protein AABO58_20735 [Acidobacteriota bacterium]